MRPIVDLQLSTTEHCCCNEQVERWSWSCSPPTTRTHHALVPTNRFHLDRTSGHNGIWISLRLLDPRPLSIWVPNRFVMDYEMHCLLNQSSSRLARRDRLKAQRGTTDCKWHHQRVGSRFLSCLSTSCSILFSILFPKCSS